MNISIFIDSFSLFEGEKFIKEHPDSPYLSQAQDRLYELYTKDGNGNFTEVPNTPFEPVQFSALEFQSYAMSVPYQAKTHGTHTSS